MHNSIFPLHTIREIAKKVRKMDKIIYQNMRKMWDKKWKRVNGMGMWEPEKENVQHSLSQ